MGFWNNLKDAYFVNEEVIHFEAYREGYYAILRRGDRLDIQRIFHIQPPIVNENDYFAFMFAQTLFGFFLFRQRVVENKPQPWEVYMELIPESPHSFFVEAHSLWWRIHRGNNNISDADV
jgi:hypothetical protein